MEDDENWRKIFVGGLHYNTTDVSLKAFYEQWGEVTDVIVMRDQATQRSRGFGFVTFRKSHMVNDCLAVRPHVVDGKEVECKRAMPREGMQQALPELHITSKKLFVGSLTEEMQEEHLREYFSQFGTVASVEFTKDRNTGQRRGFGFVTFDDYDPVDKVILMGNHEICGHQIAIKKALEREQKEMIAAGVTIRGGRGAVRGVPGRGAPGRGGRGGMRGGAVGGYYNGAAPGGYGSPAGAYGGYAGGDGYAGGPGYSDGWGQGATGAASWNQPNTYSEPAYAAGPAGPGYGAGYGGGAMKGPGYGQRAAGPYGGGFGRGGVTSPMAAASAGPGFAGSPPAAGGSSFGAGASSYGTATPGYGLGPGYGTR